MNCVPIDMLPTQGPLLPTPRAGEIRWSLLHFGTFIHGFALRNVFTHGSVTSYTSVNIYNFNSRLAHLYALWMEYIRSLRTGIMAEYPVMSTSQGTYVRIEQTSEAIRVTYEICRAGGARTRIENRCYRVSQSNIWDASLLLYYMYYIIYFVEFQIT